MFFFFKSSQIQICFGSTALIARFFNVTLIYKLQGLNDSSSKHFKPFDKLRQENVGFVMSVRPSSWK